MYEDNLYSNGEKENREPEEERLQEQTERKEEGNRYFDHVEERSGNAYRYSAVPGEPEGRRKKKKEKKSGGGFFRKAICTVALAAVFGGVAGGTFYGICRYTGVFDQKVIEVPSVSQKQEGMLLPGALEQNGTVPRVEMGDVQVIANDISGVVEEVIPAMVTFLNTYQIKEATFWGQYYTREAQGGGSGIIIGENDTELLIATNNHVVADAVDMEVTFVDGSTAKAKIKGTDADMDLAVVAVSLKDLEQATKNAIAVANLGDSNELKLGQPAIVIGNALGIGISVTDGIISGLEREMTTQDGKTGTFIQTNAAVNEGNSGGALLNIKGEVVGIVSNKLYGETVEGMGYAIPISAANPIIAELMEYRTRDEKVPESEMGYMGITPQTVTDEAVLYYSMPEGVFVVDVAEGSAAQKAGIMKGDIITKMDGERVKTAEQLREVLSYFRSGEEMNLSISRRVDGEFENLDLVIVLGKREQ